MLVSESLKIPSIVWEKKTDWKMYFKLMLFYVITTNDRFVLFQLIAVRNWKFKSSPSQYVVI